MTAWKDLERRIARRLGGERSGPLGKHGSDVTGTPWAIEIKRSKASFRVAWIEQAQEQGRRERKPWLLVVARHNDRKPIVVCELDHFLELAEGANWLDTAAKYSIGDQERDKEGH